MVSRGTGCGGCTYGLGNWVFLVLLSGLSRRGVVVNATGVRAADAVIVFEDAWHHDLLSSVEVLGRWCW